MGFDYDVNVTIMLIEQLILDGCTYCGAVDLQMSMDRINNTRPHDQDNIIASCINCNLTRGSMPYEAWEVVAKGMREARKLGLLDGWKRRA